MENGNKTMRRRGTEEGTRDRVERIDFAPSEEQVRALAHEIYRVRCDTGESGDALADWIAAEIELRRSGEDGAGTTWAATRAKENEAIGAIGTRSGGREPAT